MDLIHESAQDDFDKALAKNVSEEILKQYPGYTWAIQISSRQGVGFVRLAEFSMEFGYTFKLSDIDHDPSYRIAVRGAGEILERLGWPRGRANTDKIMTHKVVAGKALFDYHCVKNGKVPTIVKKAYEQLKGRIN